MERTVNNQAPWPEADFLRRLQLGDIQFPPAGLRVINAQASARTLEVNWSGKAQQFVFDYTATSRPKSIAATVLQLQKAGQRLKLPPLVVAPFLSEEALSILESEKISGIDLCGNGIISSPEMAIYRSGKPNRFKESQAIRNVYRGNVSLVARAFLIRGEFPSLSALRATVVDRLLLADGENPDARITKGTVSKVVQALEADCIIIREKGQIRLISRELLLRKLEANAAGVIRARSITGKTQLSPEAIWERAADTQNRFRCVLTGAASAPLYGVLAANGPMCMYVDDLDAAAGVLEVSETRVFPNITLVEEKSDVVYFDSQLSGTTRYASRVQCWLELTQAGPRERDAASDLKKSILRSFTL